jgi:N-acetylneuraminate lyase
LSVKICEFLRLADKRIPNLAGVKFTFEDLDDFGCCLRLKEGRFDILFGRDELLLSALKLGARGAVGSTYNYAAPLYQALIAAYDRGDQSQATDLQALAVRMINALLGSGALPIAAFKWFMGQVAVDCGPVRLPLNDPTADQIAVLKAKLEASGIFTWLKGNSAPRVT